MTSPTTEPAIELQGVSLRYRLATQRVGSIKEYFIHLLRGSLRYRDLWALKDLDLTVEAGEAVGVVGPNGAGKTTLAKVIAGVLKPTRGERRIHGVIAPLLELGTGFDYELTGRENIYLNALMLGRRRREIDHEIDNIVTFSGLGDFIDAPMRNYSSGMIARLGFSIATAWIPEVLILDEVLAVGDVRFLDRCHKRLDVFRDAGTTLVLISHSSRTVLKYCQRCLWLERGVVMADGDAAEVIERYEQAMHVGEPVGKSVTEPLGKSVTKPTGGETAT
jgi:ABC-2 type transport system ATP-binding protein/lipopolysaccharide transport system ATP-binding protein